MKLTPTLTIKAKDHAINSVTIFKSAKAEIVRTFSLDLKAGQNKVEIEGLPSTIDTHSVRVSGLGDARLSDVVCTIAANKESSYAPDSSSELIRLLEVQKQALESEKRIRDHEAELLVNYAKTLTGEHVAPTNMSNFLESFVEKGRLNLKAISELGEKILAIDRQIEKEKEKSASKKGHSRGKVDIILGTDGPTTVDLKLTYIVSEVHWAPTYELHATTENGKPSSSVSFHYRARIRQSTGEDWTKTGLTLSTVTSDLLAKEIPQLRPIKLVPSMFSRANNGGGGLFGNPPFPGGFRQQQQQQQQQPQQQQAQQQTTQQQPHPALNTGGAFFGQPVGGFGGFHPAAAPPPGPSGTSLFGSPSTVQAPASTFGSVFGSGSLFGSAPAVGSSAAAAGVAEEEKFEEIPNPATITEPSSFVAETPIAISYSITGESTIPSDGVEHQVSVAVLPFDAEISYVAIPRTDPRVYLQCQVKNTSEYRLLAGPVSVILDDSYVSKTWISDVNMGDNFDCTLGDDPATKVTYSRTFRTGKNEGGAFTEAMRTTSYTTKITIHNKHAFAVADLVVRDVIPTCDDKRVKVLLRKPEALATAKDGEEVVVEKEKEKENGPKIMWEKLVDGKGGEKEGKFQWKGSVKAKDKLVLEAHWEVKGPADTVWIESTLGLFGQAQ